MGSDVRSPRELALVVNATLLRHCLNNSLVQRFSVHHPRRSTFCAREKSQILSSRSTCRQGKSAIHRNVSCPSPVPDRSSALAREPLSIKSPATSTLPLGSNVAV